MKQLSKNVLVWVGVAVVAVGIVIAFVWHLGSSNPSGFTSIPAPKPLYSIGVVTEFPKSLILDSAVLASGNYMITSSTGAYIARWYSSSSMDSMFSAYESYLPQNGWDIRSENKSSSTMRAVYATNEAYSLSVTINAAKTGGSGVFILYSGGR